MSDMSDRLTIVEMEYRLAVARLAAIDARLGLIDERVTRIDGKLDDLTGLVTTLSTTTSLVVAALGDANDQLDAIVARLDGGSQ